MNYLEILEDHIKHIRYEQLFQEDFDIKAVSKKELNFLVFGKGYDDVFFGRVIKDTFDMLPVYLKTKDKYTKKFIPNYKITEELKQSFFELQKCYYSKKFGEVKYEQLDFDDQMFVDLELKEYDWQCDDTIITASNLIKEILDDYFMKVKLLQNGPFQLQNEKCLKMYHDLYLVKNNDLDIDKLSIKLAANEVYSHILDRVMKQTNFVFRIDNQVEDLNVSVEMLRLIELNFMKYTIEKGYFFNYNKLITFDEYTIEFIISYIFNILDKRYKN